MLPVMWTASLAVADQPIPGICNGNVLLRLLWSFPDGHLLTNSPGVGVSPIRISIENICN